MGQALLFEITFTTLCRKRSWTSFTIISLQLSVSFRKFSFFSFIYGVLTSHQMKSIIAWNCHCTSNSIIVLEFNTSQVYYWIKKKIMKKSKANGDCKWQLSGRWELARCLFPNALCCPCIVWSVYLDRNQNWKYRRAHVGWSPSNLHWKFGDFLTTLKNWQLLLRCCLQ